MLQNFVVKPNFFQISLATRAITKSQSLITAGSFKVKSGLNIWQPFTQKAIDRISQFRAAAGETNLETDIFEASTEKPDPKFSAFFSHRNTEIKKNAEIFTEWRNGKRFAPESRSDGRNFYWVNFRRNFCPIPNFETLVA